MYDGWNTIAILGATNEILSFQMWGLDLSGSMQGAGGAGGLLAENLAGNGVHFVSFDGDGSVAALVSACDGTLTAEYQYGSFGKSIRETGPMAKLNHFRFSTKYDNDETDFLYYGYRFYNPSTGRWLNRDPFQEDGGPHLYAFVGNHPVNAYL